MNKITKFLEKMGQAIGKAIQTVAITCHQWGDSGKGKIVDLFAEWADIIARGTGGNNAGHTIRVKGKTVIVHLVPSGIMYPGKMNVIGSGTVIDPGQLVTEIASLKESGIDCEGRLFIARNAKLVLPQHIVLDRLRDLAKSGRIGTTGRGIGPAYEDHYRRIGLVFGDLLNPGIFTAKLERSLKESVRALGSYGYETVMEIMRHKHLGEGRFCKPTGFFDADRIAEVYLKWGEELAPMIRDTDTWLREEVGRKRILLEGAQGTLLSVDHGTYPFVTASDASLEGLAKGVGLLSSQVDLALGIVKAPYMTRVGEGPFPTEMGGKKSDEWCGNGAATMAKSDKFESVREMERDGFNRIHLNDPDKFMLGVAVRIAGDEYGATTGRPRRTGWLDLPLLRWARQFSGQDIILTKLDVLSQCPTIRICVGYKYDGPDYRVDGGQLLQKGDMLDIAIPTAEVLEHCQPVYREFPGWMCDISKMKSIKDLPQRLMDIVEFIEEQAGVRARVLSVGPDRDQTIFR